MVKNEGISSGLSCNLAIHTTCLRVDYLLKMIQKTLRYFDLEVDYYSNKWIKWNNLKVSWRD